MGIEDFLSPLQDFIKPIVVYIAGRFAESGLKSIISKMRGHLRFKESIEKDSGFLIIKTISEIYIDELVIHLPDSAIDLVSTIKQSLSMKDEDRLLFGSTDKISLEFLVQTGADKMMIVTSYIGNKNSVVMEELVTSHWTANRFMTSTRISIETTEKSYSRMLYSKLLL